MQAILLIGVQGAGKSTFYQQCFFDTHVRISPDLPRTRHRERRLLELCLDTRQPFVVDSTNPTVAEPARYIEPACAAGFTVAGHFFEPDPGGCFECNERGARRVPPAGLLGTLKRLQRPHHDEGFDQLRRVVLRPDGRFAVSDTELGQGSGRSPPKPGRSERSERSGFPGGIHP